MKKEYLVLGLVALLLISACCIFFSQYVLSGCFWWECAPKRDFHVWDWELPANLFPEGAIVDHLSLPSEGHGEIEGGGQDIHIGNDIAVYEIYRFPSVRKATSDFNRMTTGMADPETGAAWKHPDNISFSSSTADDFYIACGYFHEYRCEMAARYQEYTVFFGAIMSAKMTAAEFEKIVVYIDRQVSSRLYP